MQDFLEPAVLVAGVVGDDVHDDPQVARVRLFDECVDVGQRAQAFVDIAKVGYVVATIVQWGCVER